MVQKWYKRIFCPAYHLRVLFNCRDPSIDFTCHESINKVIEKSNAKLVAIFQSNKEDLIEKIKESIDLKKPIFIVIEKQSIFTIQYKKEIIRYDLGKNALFCVCSPRFFFEECQVIFKQIENNTVMLYQ